MILDEIKKASITAMKEKDQAKKNILAIIKNKFLMHSIETGGQRDNISDEDATKIILKSTKELTETAEGYEKVNNITERDVILSQKAFLETFLPTLMNEEEIRAEINSLEDKSIPNVMKHFRANFAGKCDMGLVNSVLRSL